MARHPLVVNPAETYQGLLAWLEGCKSFTKNLTCRVLTDAIYTSHMNHSGGLFPAQHDAIIERATWEGPQDVPDRNGRTNGEAGAEAEEGRRLPRHILNVRRDDMRVFCVMLLLAAGCWGQVAGEANRDYETPELRTKIVERLEAPARLANLRPSELVSRLEIQPGSTVVDLGTGTGTLLKELSLAVGLRGRLIAEDIHTDFLERARNRSKAENLSNVDFVLGTEFDPKLPAGGADLVIILDAYHHFDYPERMLSAIKRSVRPGGRLAIIEYHKKRGAMETGDPDFALTHIRAGSDQVVREVQEAGYSLLWEREHAPGRQYIVMFRLR